MDRQSHEWILSHGPYISDHKKILKEGRSDRWTKVSTKVPYRQTLTVSLVISGLINNNEEHILLSKTITRRCQAANSAMEQVILNSLKGVHNRSVPKNP